MIQIALWRHSRVLNLSKFMSSIWFIFVNIICKYHICWTDSLNMQMASIEHWMINRMLANSSNYEPVWCRTPSYKSNSAAIVGFKGTFFNGIEIINGIEIQWISIQLDGFYFKNYCLSIAMIALKLFIRTGPGHTYLCLYKTASLIKRGLGAKSAPCYFLNQCLIMKSRG